jgi:hypothetical protein
MRRKGRGEGGGGGGGGTYRCRRGRALMRGAPGLLLAGEERQGRGRGRRREARRAAAWAAEGTAAWPAGACGSPWRRLAPWSRAAVRARAAGLAGLPRGGVLRGVCEEMGVVNAWGQAGLRWRRPVLQPGRVPQGAGVRGPHGARARIGRWRDRGAQSDRPRPQGSRQSSLVALPALTSRPLLYCCSECLQPVLLHSELPIRAVLDMLPDIDPAIQEVCDRKLWSSMGPHCLGAGIEERLIQFHGRSDSPDPSLR